MRALGLTAPAPARSALLVVLAALAVWVGAAGAQPPPAPPESVFTIEIEPGGWSPRGPSVTGRIHNRSLHRAGDVRLRVEILDEGGRVIGESHGWVYGAVPPGASTYFLVPVPRRGASYRVTVQSFSWLSLGGP